MQQVVNSRMEALLGNWLVLTCAGLLLLWFILNLGRSSGRVKNLHQKAVLITGCDSGFGHALAKQLDSLGVTVYAGVLFPDGPGAGGLKEVCSSRLQILHLDVTRDDHIAQALKTVTATLGYKKLWAVVNNAGILKFAGFEWTPMEVVKNMIEVNVLGPFRVTREFLPLLKESGGRVVIVASLAGYHSVPGLCAYNMSKHAVVGFGDSIRRELRNWSISVHFIIPSAYRTNLLNTESLLEMLTKDWENGNHFKDSYPSSYFTDYKKSILVTLALSLPRRNIYDVVHAMEDAVIGLYPKISYQPGFHTKLHHFFASILPTFIFDYLCSLIQPSTCERNRNRLLDFLYVNTYSNKNKLIEINRPIS